ncbi:hypothetical protein NP493_249g07025 [Ridgeia piscesae]|uniref:G-protein coupled receptors family 1 profile domain-containing protein n=1 Tax=Ridgeia piscesae TaxID=27915 RepID=A0AAD9NYP5_RIDPI|nr:hypothetical protein NP493_249g07025 [Ridgeia piscesae]
MTNDTPASLDDVVHVSAPVGTVCLVILVLEVVAGTIGNALLCAAVYHKRSLRTPVNALVVNLSVVGLIASTVCAPMMLAVIVRPTGARKLPAEVCLVPHALWEFVSSVQLVTLVCIGLERLQAIARPFDKLQRAHRIRVYIVVSWIVGGVNVVISQHVFRVSPILYECRTHLRLDEFRYPYGFYVLVPFILMSIVVIVVSYLGIVVLLRKNARVREARRKHATAEAAKMREKRSYDKLALPTDGEQPRDKPPNDVDDSPRSILSRATAEDRGVSAPAHSRSLPSGPTNSVSDVSETSAMESTTDMRRLADMLLYMRQREQPRARRNLSFVHVARVLRRVLRHHSASVQPVQPTGSESPRNGRRQSADDQRDASNGVHRHDILSAAALHDLTATMTRSSREVGRDYNCKYRDSAKVIADKYATPERHNDNPRTSEVSVAHCITGDDAVAIVKTQRVDELQDGGFVHCDRKHGDHLSDSATSLCANPSIVGSPVTSRVTALASSDALMDSRTTTIANSPMDSADPEAFQTSFRSAAGQRNQLARPPSEHNASLKPPNLFPPSATPQAHPFAPSPTGSDAAGICRAVSVIEIHDVDGLAMRVRNRRPDVVGSICVMSGGNRERGRRRIEAKTARTTLVIIVAFLLSWCPLTVAIFTLQLRPAADTTSTQRQHDLYMTSLCIAVFATALNPLTYGLITHQFRAELRRVRGKMSKICAKKF